MLSYNLSILKATWHQSLNKRHLIQIFGIFFLDMYSLTLYLSYSIYYRPIILPAVNLNSAKLILSAIFLFIQSCKVLGFIYFYNRNKSKYLNPMFSISIISICYLAIVVMPCFSTSSLLKLIYFVFFTAIKDFFVGYDLAMMLRFININYKQQERKFTYFFILFSSDMGILFSAFISRI